MAPTLKLTLSALTLAIGLTACGGQDETKITAAPVRTVQATISTLQLQSQAAHYIAPATVVAESQVQVASRLMGYIREIAVSEGQTVTRNQRLFSIDPVDVQGQAEQAKASLQQAENALSDARIEYDRFSALLKEDAVTRQQFEKMKLQYDMATSRVAQARAGLSTANNQLRYATVTSPINGVVTKKMANAGDLASPGLPVLVVEDPSKLQIQTFVPENILKNLKKGTTVSIQVDGQDAAIDATVAQISPAADPMSRLFMVKLDTSAKGLRSGVFARALFPAGDSQLLLVPQTALVSRAGISGVFVVDANNIAQFRMVRLGEHMNGQAEVQAGLTAGERIVSDGASKIETGDKIGG